MKRILAGAAALLLIGAAPEPAPTPVSIPVTVAPDLGHALSGRLLVFAKKVTPGEKPADSVDTSAFNPTQTAVAAREVRDLDPGRPAIIGAETDSYPTPFSDLPPGTYRVQAVLDRNHSYAYNGRGPGDLLSKVVEVQLPGPVPTITLDHNVPATSLDTLLARAPKAERTEIENGLRALKPINFQSPVMTRFWGRPTVIRGWVALPPGYAGGKGTYPTVYTDGGFTSTLRSARLNAATMRAMMVQKKIPPMIWVVLDHHIATGTHEFADSANNGPWGEALTTELIPALEKQYRMDARPSGRFLTGHSSGGWSALWLQVSYPKIFGGTWPTAPDPSDFHDFTNVDLYAANGNFYHDAVGKALPLIRDKGKVIATVKQFAQLERVLGAYGGQFASFEWVFSPKCPDGRPCPVFNRATGAIDPKVARYWIDHYDIAHMLQRDWPKIGPDLKGKIHLIVGTADTFYLDGPAHRLQAVLNKLGDPVQFRFIPGRTHFDLYRIGKDRSGLKEEIAREMYAVARPNAKPN
ncbi:alpha/beta hydrolase-fold protein [Stakelama sediminis]|uniref:S-formylglutathione hydrolase FrmB n=1 Tax=Stakelama sediminis TaxID=463200 RepID=A0A840YVV3_9SPHN|nr:alpha/beta hydrolase-fold protein [Stakelama sediminis]MBB5717778.1 S-formylglutathione hydrolase FrmB [Stakelama sediminis]